MTVKVTKPAINLREKLAELESPNADKSRIRELEVDTLTAKNIDASALTTGTLPVDRVPYVGRRNLIINGDFQVSQRGDYTTATTASHNTYYLDRWKIESGLSQTVQDTGYKQKLVITAGGTNISGFRQKIEDKTYNRLVNKTVTFSAKVTSNSANARLALYADGWHVSTPHTGGGSEETLTLTVTLPSSFTYGLIPEICICGAGYSNVAIATNDYIEAGEAQLELGSVATPFEHRSYGEELALCQRYFQRSVPSTYTSAVLDGTWDSSTGLMTNSKHNAYYDFVGILPVEMRASPTMSLFAQSGYGKLRIEIPGVTNREITEAPQSTRTSATGIQIRYMIASNADTADRTEWRTGSGNAFGRVGYELEAEL